MTAMKSGIVGAVILAIVSGASVGSALSAERSVVARGRAIAETKCARCHAISAHGSSPHRQAPPFRTLPARYDVASLAEAFAEGITVGHADMPEFVFEPKDIEAILTYIQSLAPRRHGT